ncbi:MAG: hypothetical protein Kow0069_24170 [Promethearchaeota archaeon]
MQPAVFLDRDGTLIEDPSFAFRPEQYELLPGVLDGLKALQERFLLFVITNQAGIGRGYYSVADFWSYHQLLLDDLERAGVELAATRFCPHRREDGCTCRKPSPRFIFELAAEWDVDVGASWVVGDHPSDVRLGKNAGCRTIYLLTGHGAEHLEQLRDEGPEPDHVSKSFSEVVEFILRESS